MSDKERAIAEWVGWRWNNHELIEQDEGKNGAVRGER